MKAFNLIAKIVAALAAIAGAVYVIATYGDKIVAWCKNMLPTVEITHDDVEEVEEEVSEAVEEAAEEAAEAAEEAAEELEEVEEETVVADEADFEG